VPRYYCTADTVRVEKRVERAVQVVQVVLVTAGSSLAAHGWTCSREAEAGSRALLLAGLQGVPDAGLDRGDVDGDRQAQGPTERPPLLGESHALQVVVHGGTTTRQATGTVGDEDAFDRDDTQQGGLGRSAPAPHTGADRTRETDRSRV
jgi:hypothetical protein